jgi:large-conductance mechanosensitive channel
MKIIKEFRTFTDFAVKGNIVDLAVGIIIRTAPPPTKDQELLTEIRDLLKK